MHINHIPAPNPTGRNGGLGRARHRFQLVTCWRCWYESPHSGVTGAIIYTLQSSVKTSAQHRRRASLTSSTGTFTQAAAATTGTPSGGKRWFQMGKHPELDVTIWQELKRIEYPTASWCSFARPPPLPHAKKGCQNKKTNHARVEAASFSRAKWF